MLELYWKNASDKVVGEEHGVSLAEMEALKLKLCKASQAVTKSLVSWYDRVTELPIRCPSR